MVVAGLLPRYACLVTNDKEHIEITVGVGVTSRLGAIDRHVSDTSRVPFHECTTVGIQPRLFVWGQSHKERLDCTIDIFLSVHTTAPLSRLPAWVISMGHNAVQFKLSHASCHGCNHGENNTF